MFGAVSKSRSSTLSRYLSPHSLKGVDTSISKACSGDQPSECRAIALVPRGIVIISDVRDSPTDTECHPPKKRGPSKSTTLSCGRPGAATTSGHTRVWSENQRKSQKKKLLDLFFGVVSVIRKRRTKMATCYECVCVCVVVPVGVISGTGSR